MYILHKLVNVSPAVWNCLKCNEPFARNNFLDYNVILYIRIVNIPT